MREFTAYLRPKRGNRSSGSLTTLKEPGNGCALNSRLTLVPINLCSCFGMSGAGSNLSFWKRLRPNRHCLSWKRKRICVPSSSFGKSGSAQAPGCCKRKYDLTQTNSGQEHVRTKNRAVGAIFCSLLFF